jgi:hypothetical protein
MVAVTDSGFHYLMYQADGAITGMDMVIQTVYDFRDTCWVYGYPAYTPEYGWEEEPVLVDELGDAMFVAINSIHDLLMALPEMFHRVYGEAAYEAFKIQPYMVREAVARGFITFG